MIGHQAIRKHIRPMFLSVFSQPFRVADTIRISKKDIFTPVAMLGSVARYLRTNDSRHPWHAENLADQADQAEKG